MIKVAMIGAGSIGFTRRLMMDILAVAAFRDTEFRFMDINLDHLEKVTKLCRQMIKANELPATIVATTDRKEAIRDADYVFCTARVGGLEAFRHDIKIPLKYGVDQCVGDTLGPGGVFFALRTIPLLLDIAADMREVAPEALLLNYSNPMAMNTWAVRKAGGVRVVGLCHGVQGSHRQIAKALGLPQDEVDITAAGINHQTWFLDVSHRGKDLRPFLLEAFEKHPRLSQKEPVRIDVLRRFGYYSTESNGHLSEYLPWYRKRKDEIDRWIDATEDLGGPTGGYLHHCLSKSDEYEKMYPKWLNGEAEYIQLGDRSEEHGSYILEALETGKPYRGHFNVGNDGFIKNLPEGCTVEVPCYVDRSGIHPVTIGDLPPQCAATCRASISVQEMAVGAALSGDKNLVKLAVLHDPLTAAVCTTEEVWHMCDELFETLAPWLPQFNGEGRAWPHREMPGLNRAAKPSGDWLPPALRDGYHYSNTDERLTVGHEDS